MNEPPDTDPALVLLGSIHPAPPSRQLMERLFAALPNTPLPVKKAKAHIFFPRFAAAAAIAAVGGIAVWYSFPHSASNIAADSPVAEEKLDNISSHVPAALHLRQRLLGVKDIGFARDDQSRPVRLMHATWLDQESGSAGPSAPTRVRDEIVPVVLTTY